MIPAGVILTQTREGRRIEHRGTRGQRRSVVVGREWDVYRDGTLIGQIEYDLLTRETGSATRRYVSNRWQSPGWRYRTVGPDGLPSGRFFEPLPSSRAECIRRLVREADRVR